MAHGGVFVTSIGPRDPHGAGTEMDETEVLSADAVGELAPSSSDGHDGRDGHHADSRPGTARGRRTRRVLIEWVILIVVALAIALVIKTFLVQAFYIPSSSMEPTLNIGDRVLVNKLSYDLHDVNRGDIVVFEAPPGAGGGDIKDLVKRVIGLPGETVEAEDGVVLVNRRPLSEPYLPSGTTTQFSEVPPGCDPPADGQPGCVVPRDHVLVFGDNRGNSKDGREFGPIDTSTIVGRVFVRIWPIDDIGLL
jgi:signal peptidase I